MKTWQTNRNKNEKQIKKAKKDTINQTWLHFQPEQNLIFKHTWIFQSLTRR